MGEKLDFILALTPIPVIGEKKAYEMLYNGLSEGENRGNLALSSTIFLRGISYAIPIGIYLLYYYGDKIK